MSGAMIERRRTFEAGNTYARRPVVELRIAGRARTMLAPGAVGRLLAALPPMREEVLDFDAFRRVTAAGGPVPAAAALALLALIAQRYMNWPVSFCSGHLDDEGNGARAVFEIGTRRVGLHAGRLAATILETFLADEAAELDSLFRTQLAELARKVKSETPSIDAMLIARAAIKRGIAWSTLPRSTYLRLGWGRHAHVLRGSETTRTSSIAGKLAQRKRLTSYMLTSAGLPTATQRRVRRHEDAQEAARTIGFPVVIKPANGQQGKGVSIGIAGEDQVVAAFERAQAVSRSVLVEAFIPGDEYRLLVVDGQFVAAAHRRPAMVHGDGISTLRELVSRENARPEREAILPGHMAARLPIQIDAEARALLAEQGYAEDAIPASGAVVLLRRESNVSRGGDSVDATDVVHPSIRSIAERAARVLGIDVCGVDFISTDIGRPWWETGAAICEVNTRPGLVLHTRVSEGARRDVVADVVRMLYPEGAPTRVPVVVLVEGPESAGLIEAIAAAAARAGRRLGVAGSRELVLAPDVRRLGAVATVAWDESIELAVVEVSAERVARHGLGLERIDLAVLPDAVSASPEGAAAALARVAGGQVISARHPDALGRSLAALGLDKPGPRPAAATPGEHPRPPAKAVNPDRFDVLMVGDIGFGESYLHYRRAAPLRDLLVTHGHGHCFGRLGALLRAADLTIGNLEVPLSGRPDESLEGRKKYLGWSDADPAVHALEEAGISAVSLANNHSLDCGTSGLAETIRRLHGCGIASFGAGDDLEAADRPLVVTFTLDGIERSLVVFAGFELRRRYEHRYRWYARAGAPGVAEISAPRVAAAVAALRDRLPSPTFVAYPHWGTDYEGVVDRQRSYAAALVDAGVDLIVGHGSHTAQAIEVIDGRPVVYGLGNFVWNTPGRYDKLNVRPFGLAAALVFRAGRPGQARLRLYPLLTDNAVTGFRNRPVTGPEFSEAARELAARLAPAPRRGTDAVGHYLEMGVPIAAPGQTKAAEATDRTAPSPEGCPEMAAPAALVAGAGTGAIKGAGRMAAMPSARQA